MRILCPHCGTVRNAKTISRIETYTYKGESITLSHESSVCTVCEAEVAKAQQAEDNLIAVREAYRSRHDLISPDEIRRIRERYGAGQKPFGVILGLGKSTIANYERGELPTAANSNLIRLMEDPHAFRTLFEERRELIGPTQQKRVAARIGETTEYPLMPFGELAVRETADEYTGFRRPDQNRVEALLRMIVSSLVGSPNETVFKMKLLKLCFLADIEHFRRHTVSITGWPYARLPHGPVLQEYKLILDVAEQHGVIQTEDFDDGTTVVRLGNRKQGNNQQTVFTEDELATINDVLKRWGNASATALSDYTHKLPAYNRTAHAREISYVLALESGGDA